MSDYKQSSPHVAAEVEKESQLFDGSNLKNILVEIGHHYNRYAIGISSSIEEAYQERRRTCYLPTFTAINWAMNRGCTVGISVNKRAHPMAFIETPESTLMFDYLANEDPIRMKEYPNGAAPRFLRIANKRELIATIQIFDALEEIMGLSETGQPVDFEKVDSLDFTSTGYFKKLARNVAANPL